MEKGARSVGAKGLVSWAFFDWAHSAHSAIIQTFVFAVYFTRKVAVSETEGTAQWGLAIGLAGLLVALLGPVLGAIADHGGRRKPWLFLFSLAAILTSGALWFVKPSPLDVPFAMVTVVIATSAAEFAFIFYNAMLPDLAPSRRVGFWSGMGWGLGYVGGTACLILALVLFLNGESTVFSLDTESAANVRITFVLCAVWFALFSLPLFFFTPDVPGSGKTPLRAVKDGLSQLWTSLAHLRDYAHILRFLVARMFYIDGLVTLFVFGGVYAAGTFGMDEREVLLFGIALNVASGIGAGLLACFDDRFGGRAMILTSLVGLMIPGVIILLVDSATYFWLLGLAIGVFVGPVQASSRSYMARVAPAHMRNEMFGFFALSGKATAFLGPMMVGWVTWLTDSQRMGMSVIFALLFVGWALMLTVPSDLEEKN